jgi:serine/threonine protein kinase
MSTTAPGVVLGTVGYMAPEQARGETSDAASDIFSFGAVLYEMLSGERAFQGTSSIETLSAILREQPADLTHVVPGLSPALARIVDRCLEKNKDDRFQTAADLDSRSTRSRASRRPPSCHRGGRACAGGSWRPLPAVALGGRRRAGARHATDATKSSRSFISSLPPGHGARRPLRRGWPDDCVRRGLGGPSDRALLDEAGGARRRGRCR